MKTFFAASALLISAGIASAGGTFDSTGTISGQSTASIHAISDGFLVMELTNTHDSFDMAAADHPFNGLTGTCTGAAIMRGPSVEGGGVCQYKNADGDTSFVEWDVDSISADGAIQGNWAIIGGTGGRQGLTGGGRYISMTDRATGKITANLMGAVTQP